MAALWDDDRRKKDERERADREAAVKRNEEVKAILDLQVDLCRKSRTEDDVQKKAADCALMDEWHRLRHVEQELERQHKRNDIEVCTTPPTATWTARSLLSRAPRV